MLKQWVTTATGRIEQAYRHTGLLAALIILLAVGLRAYHFGTYAFGFDQVQILENARSILSGDFTLIGPRTGPAPMFTGPFIYYVTAILMIFVPAPHTVIATSLLFAAVTGVTLYLLCRWIFPRSQTLTLLCLWAYSPFLVAMDRISWNPNLSVLSSSLIFFPLYRLLTTDQNLGRQQWLSLALIAVGGFLGYQAHFSGLMLPVVVLLAAASLKQFKVALLSSLAAGLGLLISLLPTIFFDWRHQWLNLKGILALSQNSGGADLSERLQSAIITFEVVLKNIGWIMFWDTNKVILIFIGMGLIVCLLWQLKQNQEIQRRRRLLLPLLWVLISSFFYIFYRGSKPEYYFLIQIPAILLLLEQGLFAWLRTVRGHYIALGILFFYTVIYSSFRYQITNGVNFANQVAVSHYIHHLASIGPVQKITYDMEPVHSLGLQYLLSDLPPAIHGAEVHVLYPYPKGSLVSFTSHDLGVWTDTRRTSHYHYLTLPNYIIGSPLTTTFYPDQYPAVVSQGRDTYKISVNDIIVNELWVINSTLHPANFTHFIESVKGLQDKQGTWQYFRATDFSGWIYAESNNLFVLPLSESQKDSVIPFLKTLEMYN